MIIVVLVSCPGSTVKLVNATEDTIQNIAVIRSIGYKTLGEESINWNKSGE